jgi:hypothetical protein
MASYGLPAFESPAPRPNKDALHRILENVVTTNERLAVQEDKLPQTVRPPLSVQQAVTPVPRFRSATTSWQDAENPDMYDVDVPVRANNTADKSFSGLFSSGAHTNSHFACALVQAHNYFSPRGRFKPHLNNHAAFASFACWYSVSLLTSPRYKNLRASSSFLASCQALI